MNANKDNLSLALKNILGANVKTNASVSVKSKTMNLSEVLPNITVEEVMKSIILEYNNSNNIEGVNVIDFIDDEIFPGVMEIENMFLSKEWIYERTPKFEILRDIFNDIDIVSAFLVVEKGRVSNIGIKRKDLQLSVQNNNLSDLSELFSGLMEKPFSKDVLDEFEMVVYGLRNSEKCMAMVVNR